MIQSVHVQGERMVVRISADLNRRATQGEFQPIKSLAADGHLGGSRRRCPQADAPASGGDAPAGGCFLFAGRFPPVTAPAVLAVMHARDNPLQMIQVHPHAAAPQQQYS